MIDTIDALSQHQLVILRRLRGGPLTEFELASEIAEHSGYSVEECTDNMTAWLGDLRHAGLIWAGTLSNDAELEIWAAALTKRGRELVG